MKLTQPTTPAGLRNSQSAIWRKLEVLAPSRRSHADFHGIFRVRTRDKSHSPGRAVGSLVVNCSVAEVEASGVGLGVQHRVAVQGSGGLGGNVETIVAAGVGARCDEVEDLLERGGGGRGCEEECGEEVHFE